MPIAEWAAKNGIKTVVTLVSDYGPGLDSEKAFFEKFTSMGGKVLAPVRAAQVVAKGTAASLPMDLGFEVLAAGGELDGNSFKQALAESLVFGGTGAAFGAVVRGNLDQKRRQQMGDEINFRSTLEDTQKARFMTLGLGARRTIGTFSAMYPSLNFQLTDSGASSYSRETNTATINVKQSDWIKPLVAHEVNHYIAARAQMEDGISALLVGPEGVGGLLRGRDGTLDPNFKAAMDAYNARVRRDGNPALTPEQFAVEYFNEATVDDLVGMVDSGEMQTMAARTDGERVLREMVGSLISKTPILGDLFVKLGGAYDKGGNMVQGNGLLAGGVRELPGAKRLLRQMVQKQAGRRNLEIDPSMTEKGASKEKGVVLPEEMVKNGPIADSLFSQFQMDENGKAKRDADGNPIPIDRATEIKREMAGKIIIELQKERIRRGEQLPEGSIEWSDEFDAWIGESLDDEQIAAISRDGIFNVEQIRTGTMLNAEARKRSGATYAMVYQGAIARGKNGKVKYAAIAPTFREVVPVGVKITKAGNILIQTMSVTQLMENIRERSKTKLGKKLYNGDQTTMLRDVEAMLALHKKGKETLPFFKEKYGESLGTTYRNFANTLFGLMTSEQQNINPLFETEGVKYSSNVFKSRRLDRINHTARLIGRPAMPFGYDQVKANLFPVGVPGGGSTVPLEAQRSAVTRDIPMSAVNVLHNDSSILPKPSKKRGNDSVAKDLEQAAINHWGRKLTSKDITEQEIEQIIDLGVDEFIAAFSASGKTASNWYSTAIEAAMAVAAVIHPELTDAAVAAKAPGLQKHADPVHAANLAMKLALAITSQNLSVELNARFAEEQFDIFRNTGYFDYSKVYGEKAESISGNLNSANILLRKLGSREAEQFIQSEFTIQDLNEAAEAILGRKVSIAGKVDDVVNGAALFGPKIGQGFLQNIMGRFSPVTIDLWLRRTWGRWTGDVVGGGANSETLARMLDAARESGLDLGPLKGVRAVDRKRKSGSNFRSVSDTVADRLENDADFNAQVYDVAKNLHALGQKH
jgi:hypothetical protein